MGPDGERRGRSVAGQHGPVRQRGAARLPNMSYMPLAFITAKTGKNVKALLNLSQSLFKQAQRRVEHRHAQPRRSARPSRPTRPPSRENRNPRVSTTPLRSASQPPTIVLFVNSTRFFDPTYQRYLLNVFREKSAVPRHPDQALPAGPQADRPRGAGRRATSLTSRPTSPLADPASTGPLQTAQPVGNFDPSVRFLRPRGQRVAFGTGLKTERSGRWRR